MLLLLPPSESKAAGGDGPPLDLTGLSFPALTAVRIRLLQELTHAAEHTPQQLQAALGLSAGQLGELEKNAALPTAATVPAIVRYTGVLYDALDYRSLPEQARQHADRHVAIASALFGLLAPVDLIPAYRLSGGTRLPAVGPLAALWRPALEPLLAEEVSSGRLLVDLRSGAYSALGRAAGAVTVRVLRERDGRRTVVSHDNKSTKGDLLRQVCLTGARSFADLLAAAHAVADTVEVDGLQLDLILRDDA